jgi:hypothetical protein
VCRVVCKHLRASQRHAMFCSCWVLKQAWWLSNQRGSESRQGGERANDALLACVIGGGLWQAWAHDSNHKEGYEKGLVRWL